MNIYLLDVNLLLALADPVHVHHEAAHRWFAATGQHGWATCPVTENGFVRIASHPRYPNRPGDVAATLGILREFCAHPGHSFWPDSATLRDLVSPQAVLTSNHVTDIYLLGLAGLYGGKLATFDRSIPVTAVENGASFLELVETGGF